MSFKEDVRKTEKAVAYFCLSFFFFNMCLLFYSFYQAFKMEYVGIKILLTLGFFATLIGGAYWAGEKFKEYWGDDDNGRQSTGEIYGKNLHQNDRQVRCI